MLLISRQPLSGWLHRRQEDRNRDTVQTMKLTKRSQACVQKLKELRIAFVAAHNVPEDQKKTQSLLMSLLPSCSAFKSHPVTGAFAKLPSTVTGFLSISQTGILGIGTFLQTNNSGVQAAANRVAQDECRS